MRIAHRLRLVSALGIVASCGLVSLTSMSAEAAYPGTNGRLAFGLYVEEGGQADIYSVLPNGQGLRRLTDDPGQDLCASYSPDGRFIAWCSSAGNANGGTDIWVMKQNGQDKRRVTHLGGNVNFPDFAPKGH